MVDAIVKSTEPVFSTFNSDRLDGDGGIYSPQVPYDPHHEDTKSDTEMAQLVLNDGGFDGDFDGDFDEADERYVRMADLKDMSQPVTPFGKLGGILNDGEL